MVQQLMKMNILKAVWNELLIRVIKLHGSGAL